MRPRIGAATAVLALSLAIGACSTPEDLEGRFTAHLTAGVAAIEADDPASAVTAFTEAAAVLPERCEPQLGLVLAHTLRFVHQVQAFSATLAGGEVGDPDRLRVEASDEGNLIEALLVRPLLAPLLEILTDLDVAAKRLGTRSCALRVDFPVKVAFGTWLIVNLRLGPLWTHREAALLSFFSSALLAADRLLLSHDLEVPPLTAIKLVRKLDRSNGIALLRSLGLVPAEAPNFLAWNPDPERRALFDRIPGDVASAFVRFAALARLAKEMLVQMPFWTRDEVFWIRDRDENGAVSPGDRLVLNVRGKVQVNRDPPIEVSPLEFRIGPAVRPDVLDQAIAFLDQGASVFAGEATPGTRLKLESLNGIFVIFGQERPFEDVLELDPLAYFYGPLRADRWERVDLNDNCLDPRGEDLVCTCAPSRTVTDETGKPVTVSVQPDITVIENGVPVERCLREGYGPINGRYPDPPRPAPLREFFPYWYEDPFLDEGTPVFGVEGEKSLNLLPSIPVPPYITYGDFDHFFFGEVLTDEGLVDLYLPRDCIEPPLEDRFGIVTIPYLAYRDPTFGGAVYVNLSILTGGDCADSQTPLYRVWAPADRYSLNKVVAHYAVRYGRLVYDLLGFVLE